MYASCPARRLRRVTALWMMLLLLPPLALGSPVQQERQAEVRKLEADKPIERELAGGQSHTYEVTLTAGQFIKVVVEQRGIDVAVTATGPDGKELFAVNDEPRAQGVEEVPIVAELAGGYRLRVAASQPAAPAARYEIRVAEVRAATESDRALHEARTLSAAFVRLRNAGKYDEALPLAERALAIREKALGPEHPLVAASLHNLAALYYFKGDYVKAEPLWQRTLAICEKTLGPDHPEVARSLNNLASLYHNKGNLARAEPLHQRALTVFEKALGPDHPNVATSLNNLANLYGNKGDFGKAEPLIQRALAIFEKALGPDHPNVAQSLNNLANLYYQKGDFGKAEPLYQRAIAIREKALGPDHPEVIYPLNNLANLYDAKGDYAKAEPLYQRALAVWEKALGPDHPQVAHPLNNLAGLYRVKGDLVKAEPLCQRALAVWEKALGPDHPNVAQSLNNLANLYRDKGDYAKASSHQSRAVLVSERNIERNVATGSERQKLAYLTTLSWEVDNTLALHTRYMPDDLPALRLALTIILQRKGRALDVMADSIAALRRRLDPQDQALLDQLTDARARQAKLVLDGPGRKKPAEHQAEIKQLGEEIERLEDTISRRSAEFRAQAQPVTLEAVQAIIPPGAALVEFAVYRFYDPKRPEAEKLSSAETRYLAYVLRHQGEPRWVDLGAAQAIDDAVAVLRAALRDPRRSNARRRARAVDQKVMRPVRRLLGQTRRVLLAPDGALNLVPFAALVDERGRYLVSRYSFTYLTSGRDLLRLREKRPATRGALVVADPDFGDRTAASAHHEHGGRRSVDFAQAYFTPLPGTQEEAQALRNILPDARVLTGPEATEAAVKQVAAPPVLHLATHGFFLEDVYFGSQPGEGRGLVHAQGQAKELENPLLRSGLALTGANSRKSGEDDGILTALETAGLNLWGTKLVVLSACDTGVGEVVNHNGVFGLRRALVLAGSESQVMSLWPVSDAATRDLMIEYYKGLQAGQGRTEALRRVQLKMLASGKRRHPYYWASFIQSGEWASLDGTRR